MTLKGHLVVVLDEHAGCDAVNPRGTPPLRPLAGDSGFDRVGQQLTAKRPTLFVPSATPIGREGIAFAGHRRLSVMPCDSAVFAENSARGVIPKTSTSMVANV